MKGKYRGHKGKLRKQLGRYRVVQKKKSKYWGNTVKKRGNTGKIQSKYRENDNERWGNYQGNNRKHT